MPLPINLDQEEIETLFNNLPPLEKIKNHIPGFFTPYHCAKDAVAELSVLFISPFVMTTLAFATTAITIGSVLFALYSKIGEPKEVPYNLSPSLFLKIGCITALISAISIIAIAVLPLILAIHAITRGIATGVQGIKKIMTHAEAAAEEPSSPDSPSAYF